MIIHSITNLEDEYVLDKKFVRWGLVERYLWKLEDILGRKNNMKLRFFQTYNKNGMDSAKTLQYLDEDDNRWLDVDFVRVRESEEEKYLCHEHPEWVEGEK